MRIISGTAKGRRLFSPKSDKIRPALDKVKEAIFNILFDVSGLSVLDLFAGTGSVGIEALSRGAKEATFVDNYKEAIELIKRNIALCGFEKEATVIMAPVREALKKKLKGKGPFDLIFIDPPYEKNLVNPTLEELAKTPLYNNESTIIIEHHPKEPILPGDNFMVTDERHYGQTNISFLKPTKKPVQK